MKMNSLYILTILVFGIAYLDLGFGASVKDSTVNKSANSKKFHDLILFYVILLTDLYFCFILLP
jgi:hypothetical protein